MPFLPTGGGLSSLQRVSRMLDDRYPAEGKRGASASPCRRGKVSQPPLLVLAPPERKRQQGQLCSAAKLTNAAHWLQARHTCAATPCLLSATRLLLGQASRGHGHGNQRRQRQQPERGQTATQDSARQTPRSASPLTARRNGTPIQAGGGLVGMLLPSLGASSLIGVTEDGE